MKISGTHTTDISQVATPSSTESASTVVPRPFTSGLTCQVCFEDIPPSDNSPAAAVTRLCSPDCSAVLCVGCVREHLRVAIDSTYTGILPRVRCPVCLVLMNKSKWEKYATQSTLEEYKASCERACSFRAPCCHNENYTHLPVAFNATKRQERYIVPKLRLVPSLKAKVPDLRQQIKRFANHKIPSSSLVRYIQEEFGKKLIDEQQHLLVEHLLPRILDEERRATFMMAYLAKYTITKTRCCGRDVCYNCKRKLSWHYNEGQCDQRKLSADCILECRSCHVTMVKVEGCSSVKCWCGFYMTWPEEIRIRGKNARGLIPVDIFDLEVYRRWSKWQYNIDRALKGELASYVLAIRLSRLDQELPPYKRVLREMLQRYIWWRRFRKSLPEFKEQLMKGSMDQEMKRQTRIALRRRGAVMMVLRTS